MKCEYCNQEKEQMETDDHKLIWVCNCEIFRNEQKVRQDINDLEQKLIIAKQELTAVQSKSIFVKQVIKLNDTYGKHMLC